MSTIRWRCFDCSRRQNKYRETTLFEKNANLSTRQINQLYSSCYLVIENEQQMYVCLLTVLWLQEHTHIVWQK